MARYKYIKMININIVYSKEKLYCQIFKKFKNTKIKIILLEV